MIVRLRSTGRAGPAHEHPRRPAPEPRITRGKEEYVAVAAPAVGEQELARVMGVVRSGFVSSAGPAVGEFEARLAARCRTEHAVALSSGTHALELLMYAFECGPGDEVIVPALTFISVGWAVASCGARPVYVDVERGSLNLDVGAVEAAITDRTRGIIAVHTYGHPCDITALRESADRARLFIIEDACEALGGELRGAPVGGLGDVAVHSFYANKMVTTGNGGAVTTDHAGLDTLLRNLRGYSSEPGYHFWHSNRPFNVRMTALQAALGCAQLDRLEELVEVHERLAARYASAIEGIEGLHEPKPCSMGRHTYWMYTLHVDEPRYGASAADVRRWLAERGIETRAVFTPLPAQPVLRDAEQPPDGFPAAEWAAHTGINLPSGPHVRPEHVERIAAVLRARGPT